MGRHTQQQPRSHKTHILQHELSAILIPHLYILVHVLRVKIHIFIYLFIYYYLFNNLLIYNTKLSGKMGLLHHEEESVLIERRNIQVSAYYILDL